ncbi:sulfatase-like hydrolase/transferase [Solitalea lacus]|uniref:sulfatase-like hydrolase/transferase n=1 Tax=Solitalea lacus TaxID=2911172 RepID=UPI001EDB6498|nr:sulfatase-like hydrolase/transferase [Solitalea lacus]UKJ09317.1 sulfatase-like hydrolase/transferase [Solitalea lacus]
MKKIIKWVGPLFTILGVIFLTSFTNLRKPKSETPNVILILMDDLGYGDLECYGGFPYHTPNLNKLAAGGMRFTNFYVAQATCSASRSAFLTGCYPNRIGISGALSPNSETALNPEEETIAKLLRDKGYKTGMFGKWHLGQKAPYLPVHYGFDEFTGLPYSHDYWPVNYDGKPLDASTDRGKWPVLRLLEGDNPVKEIRTLDDAAELTTFYTNKAVDFIKRNKKNPFFLYLAHPMPHVPLAVSVKFKGKSNAGLFGDVMEEIDWSVGEIMKTLEANGLTKNTMVIFTSDNGPWLTYGNHAGNTGGFREGKGTAWEGGVRVPFIVHWPNQIASGTICNNMAASMDILPTLMRVCGATLPRKKIDGVDVFSLFKQVSNANPRDEFAYYYDRCSLKGIRKGQWVLTFPCVSQTYKKATAIGNDGWPGKYASDSVKLALYDLRTDPGETMDVKEKYPEIVKQLSEIAEKYRKEIGDDLTKQKGLEVRPAAKVNLNR